jgi:nucleotide-binding universal stress UspA family protein
MKKILFATDGKHFSEGAFEFVRHLNSLSPITLTGIFLPQVDLSRYLNYATAAKTGIFYPELEEEESKELESSIDHFKSLCTSNHITSESHNCCEEQAIPAVEAESRFADALVIGSETFYKNDGNGTPNAYLKEVLHHAECPVLLIPEKFKFPDSIIFCYDGSASAVFAIRQFAYLFPELTDRPLSILYLGDKEGELVPNQKAVMQLMSRCFKNMKVLSLGEDMKHAMNWLRDLENPIVVAGSYGRSSLSRMFSKSFITTLIREHTVPIFIAHK